MEGREVCLQSPVGSYSKCIYYLQSLREGSGRTDEFTRVSFRVFLQKLYSLICLSCHLSAYIIALIYFFFKFEFFFFLKFWPLLNRSRASRRRFHCLHRRKRTGRLTSLSVRTPAHAACSTAAGG